MEGENIFKRENICTKYENYGILRYICVQIKPDIKLVNQYKSLNTQTCMLTVSVFGYGSGRFVVPTLALITREYSKYILVYHISLLTNPHQYQLRNAS